MISDPRTAAEILRSCRLIVAPGTFTLISVDRAGWQRLLSDPALSPRMTSPFLILMDAYEVTLMVDDTDLAAMRSGLSDAKIEKGFRMLTFDSAMGFDVVGFIARVAQILAAAGVPILPIAAFSRDHVLVKQDHLAAALRALGPHVEELC
jgi:hypothetical protein